MTLVSPHVCLFKALMNPLVRLFSWVSLLLKTFSATAMKLANLLPLKPFSPCNLWQISGADWLAKTMLTTDQFFGASRSKGV